MSRHLKSRSGFVAMQMSLKDRMRGERVIREQREQLCEVMEFVEEHDVEVRHAKRNRGTKRHTEENPATEMEMGTDIINNNGSTDDDTMVETDQHCGKRIRLDIIQPQDSEDESPSLSPSSPSSTQSSLLDLPTLSARHRISVSPPNSNSFSSPTTKAEQTTHKQLTPLDLDTTLQRNQLKQKLRFIDAPDSSQTATPQSLELFSILFPSSPSSNSREKQFDRPVDRINEAQIDTSQVPSPCELSSSNSMDTASSSISTGLSSLPSSTGLSFACPRVLRSCLKTSSPALCSFESTREFRFSLLNDDGTVSLHKSSRLDPDFDWDSVSTVDYCLDLQQAAALRQKSKRCKQSVETMISKIPAGKRKWKCKGCAVTLITQSKIDMQQVLTRHLTTKGSDEIVPCSEFVGPLYSCCHSQCDWSINSLHLYGQKMNIRTVQNYIRTHEQQDPIVSKIVPPQASVQAMSPPSSDAILSSLSITEIHRVKLNREAEKLQSKLKQWVSEFETCSTVIDDTNSEIDPEVASAALLKWHMDAATKSNGIDRVRKALGRRFHSTHNDKPVHKLMTIESHPAITPCSSTLLNLTAGAHSLSSSLSLSSSPLPLSSSTQPSDSTPDTDVNLSSNSSSSSIPDSVANQFDPEQSQQVGLSIIIPTLSPNSFTPLRSPPASPLVGQHDDELEDRLSSSIETETVQLQSEDASIVPEEEDHFELELGLELDLVMQELDEAIEPLCHVEQQIEQQPILDIPIEQQQSQIEVPLLQSTALPPCSVSESIPQSCSSSINPNPKKHNTRQNMKRRKALLANS